MAVTSTPEKTAMLSIPEKNIAVLDLCNSCDSCDVDKPLIRKAVLGNVSPSQNESISEFNLLPDNLVGGGDSSGCCGGAVQNNTGHRLPCCSDNDHEDDSESGNTEVNEDGNAADIRCDDSDKTVGTAIETDSGNGGSCCENNPDEFLDDSNIDEDRDEQKQLQSSGLSSESNESTVGGEVVKQITVHDHEVLSSPSNDLVLQAVCDCDDKCNIVIKEMQIENREKVPELKSIARTAAASCSQPVGSRDGPGPHIIPRLHRQRMGSYGSPPPSASMTRETGFSPPSGPSSTSAPDEDVSKQQQYVVNVHVNPGETFSVCLSDQVQLIQGQCALFSFCYFDAWPDFRLSFMQ